MSVWKTLEPSNISYGNYVNKRPVTVSSSSLSRIQFLSGSNTDLQGAYYNSLRINFYASSSELNDAVPGAVLQAVPLGPNQTASETVSAELVSENKFDRIQQLGVENPRAPQHRHKFYKTGSIVNIPTKFKGDFIIPGSFKLTDNSTSKTVVLQDDGSGNLYAASASISQSALSLSGSDNYIGNIFYELGVVTITDTGSFSASIDYTDVTSGQYEVSFLSGQTIYSNTYRCIVERDEFNVSNNPSLKRLVVDSPDFPGSTFIGQSPYMIAAATQSAFTVFANEVGLYNDNYELLATAKISQPVGIRKDLHTEFVVQLDI